MRSKYLLGLLIASLLAIYTTVAVTQYRQYRELDRVMRQGDINAMWSFAQLAVEYERLSQAVYAQRFAPQEAASQELALRYEVFISRIGLVDTGTPKELMAPYPIYAQAMQQLHAFEDLADAMLPDMAPSTLARVQERLADMRDTIRQLSVQAAQATGALIDRRNQALQEQTREAAVITALQGILTLMLALAMANQFRNRERAQAVALEARNKLVESLQRSEELLEAHVQERTADLQTANESLRLQESELVTARAAAEESSRLKSNFLANMSHEIRSPLNAVIGMSHLMLSTTLSPQQRDYAEKIQRSGQHLLGLINDILDFSKIEAGRMEVESVEFTLPSVLDGISDLLGAKAAAKGLALVFDIAPDMPPRLRGDPLRLGQILINYVNNAIKFTETGRVVVQARHDMLDDGRLLLRVEVHDTGIGLSPQQLGGLFQSFQQADASITRKFGGTGLGLAISRHLAALMEGEVGATSVAGRGSTFWFTARLQVPEGVPDERPGVQGPSPEAERRFALQLSSPETTAGVFDRVPLSLRGARVLLVDDIELNQQVGTDLLRSAGIDVDLAANGQDALDRLAEQRYDLVLMDMQMPVMDGLTATRRIRQDGRWRQLPVVAMTANAMATDRARCLEAGMNDHLAKPVDPAELFRVLERWIPSRTADAPVPPASALAGARPEPLDSAHAEARAPLAVQVSDALLQIAGLDVASALPRLQFRLDRYQSLLQRFVQGQRDAVPRARRAWSEGRLPDALRILHTLKGTAATIGARALAERADAAEKAVESGADAHVPQERLDAAEAACTQLVAALQSVLCAPTGMQAAEHGESTSKAHDDTPEAVREVLLRVLHLVEQDSPDAVDVMQQSEATLRRALGPAFAPLAETLTQYDFETGRELLQRALSAPAAEPSATG